jgi:hypothetical protein
MSSVKEPHFFSFDSKSKQTSGPGDSVPNAITDWNSYLALFDDVRDQKAIGEASPTYLYRLEAPERIHAMLPNVKLIAILRHPADRAYSAFMHAVRDQREIVLDFREAIALEEQRKRDNWGPLWHYVSAGFYYQQLKRYYDLFNNDQIKVILQDELFNKPEEVLREIFNFLGVDPKFSSNLSIKYNVSGIHKNPIIHWFTKNLFKRPNPIRWISRKLIPESCRFKVTTWINQKNIIRKRIPDDIRQDLIELYREDIQKLQTLIGKDLSHWME